MCDSGRFLADQSFGGNDKAFVYRVLRCVADAARLWRSSNVTGLLASPATWASLCEIRRPGAEYTLTKRGGGQLHRAVPPSNSAEAAREGAAMGIWDKIKGELIDIIDQ